MDIFDSIGPRLRGERDRIGLSQTDLAEVAAQAGAPGATRQSQALYEKGKRFPDAAYLAAVATAGVDVRYVLTGEHGTAPDALLPVQEQRLLALFRLADPSVQMAVLGALSAGTPPEQPSAQMSERSDISGTPSERPSADMHVVVHGTVGQQITGGVNAPQTINMGTSRPRKRVP